MAVLNKEEFFSCIHDRMGDDTSDEAITFIENMSDTYNDLERQAKGDGVNWEQKYNDLNESWKKRYRHRFFNGGANDYVPETMRESTDERPEDITIEQLFK